MTRWHETITANIGLRVGGIVLLILARVQAWRLHHIVQMNFSGQATPLQILLAAMTFLSASIGCALLFVGPGLWRRVRVSERWARRLSDPNSHQMKPYVRHDDFLRRR